MSAAAAAATPPPASQTGANVAKMPEVVIEETRFEGKEVATTVVTIQGGGKLVPEAVKSDNRVVSVDDILTITLDVKVTGIYYATDSSGLLSRVQQVRPIEGVTQIVDVVRARDTRIR